jgi:hypothetical protein
MLFAALLVLHWYGFCLLDGGEVTSCGQSLLYEPAYCLDDLLRGLATPYFPQPGDIFLATDPGLGTRLTHVLAFSGPPHHAGIVFARSDGSLAILEAGPHNTLRVRVIDLLPHLQGYACVAKVYIRRRRVPLTGEQAAQLTCFAIAHEGKPFALVRLAAQLTPFRSRGPLRTNFMGKPHDERRSYFCAELVMAACVAAGLLDPARTRPAVTYPRDIFFGDSLNPFLHKYLDINCSWYPPARWQSCPGPLSSVSR